MQRIARVPLGSLFAIFLAGTAIAADNGADKASALFAGTVRPPRDFPDVRLASDPKVSEYANSVAVNPVLPGNLLAAFSREFSGAANDCAIRASADGGKTWRTPVRLPVPAGQVCSLPTIAYAPDGSRVYAIYARSLPPGCHLDDCSNDILFSTSEDDGKTWSTPVVAIDGADANVFIEPPALATPTTKSDRKHVYVMAKLAYGQAGHFRDLVFAQSDNGGQTWSKPKKLASFAYMTGGAHNYSVAGGAKGDVLVAWDYLGSTGAGINTQYSRDFGRTFDAPAAADQEQQVPLDPDVKLDAQGMAHLVYRVEHVQEQSYSIRYTYSRSAPFKTWSTPVTINDDAPGHAHLAPAMAVESCGRTSLLHVTWPDSRRGPGSDVFYTRKMTGAGYAWSKNIRVSGLSAAMSAPWNGLAAVGGGMAFALWSFRADPNVYSFDVYGSRIDSGVSCAH